jgi:hypothetical protein
MRPFRAKRLNRQPPICPIPLRPCLHDYASTQVWTDLLARFSGSDASYRNSWLAGSITDTPGFRFSARTGGLGNKRTPFGFICPRLYHRVQSFDGKMNLHQFFQVMPAKFAANPIGFVTSSLD